MWKILSRSALKPGIQKKKTGIQRNPQDSVTRLYKNCLEIMSMQMLYFSIHETRVNKKQKKKGSCWLFLLNVSSEIVDENLLL